MRNFTLIALLIVIFGCPSLASAQEGNAAEPSINDRPLDLSERQSPWGRWNIDITDHDRVYAINSKSEAVSVIDPKNDKLIGMVRLADSVAMGQWAASLSSPVLGYAPNGKVLAITSTKRNSVTFLDTQSNTTIRVARFDGSPSGVAYTPNGRQIWIPVGTKNYIAILDGRSLLDVARIKMVDKPGPTAFSNNGRYAYVCSGSSLQVTVFDVRTRNVIAILPQPGSSCTGIAASPDGRQIWLASSGTGQAIAFSARSPFEPLKTVEAGPGLVGVNFASNDEGQFAYVSVAGLNAVKVFDTQSLAIAAYIPVARNPAGVWPSGDGSRMYVGSADEQALTVIDTSTMKVMEVLRVGQYVGAVAYVPHAVRSVRQTSNIQPVSITPVMGISELHLSEP